MSIEELLHVVRGGYFRGPSERGKADLQNPLKFYATMAEEPTRAGRSIRRRCRHRIWASYAYGKRSRRRGRTEENL